MKNAETEAGNRGGAKEGVTILNTGIVCSWTVPAPAVHDLYFNREFQRPSSFQSYIGSETGELSRALAVSQGRMLILSSKKPNNKNKNYGKLFHAIRGYSELCFENSE